MKKLGLIAVAVFTVMTAQAQIPLDVHKVLDITQSGDTIEVKNVGFTDVFIKSRREVVKLSMMAIEPEVDLRRRMERIKLEELDYIAHSRWDVEQICKTSDGRRVEIRHNWLHGFIKFDTDGDGNIDRIILMKIQDGKPVDTYLF